MPRDRGVLQGLLTEAMQSLRDQVRSQEMLLAGSHHRTLGTAGGWVPRASPLAEEDVTLHPFEHPERGEFGMLAVIRGSISSDACWLRGEPELFGAGGHVGFTGGNRADQTKNRRLKVCARPAGSIYLTGSEDVSVVRATEPGSWMCQLQDSRTQLLADVSMVLERSVCPATHTVFPFVVDQTSVLTGITTGAAFGVHTDVNNTYVDNPGDEDLMNVLTEGRTLVLEPAPRWATNGEELGFHYELAFWPVDDLGERVRGSKERVFELGHTFAHMQMMLQKGFVHTVR
jgi:hypothetical protein